MSDVRAAPFPAARGAAAARAGGAGRGVALDEHLIAAPAVALAAEEVVEADLVEGGGRRVGGDVAADADPDTGVAVVDRLLLVIDVVKLSRERIDLRGKVAVQADGLGEVDGPHQDRGVRRFRGSVRPAAVELARWYGAGGAVPAAGAFASGPWLGRLATRRHYAGEVRGRVKGDTRTRTPAP